jgi:hypothetical protein
MIPSNVLPHFLDELEKVSGQRTDEIRDAVRYILTHRTEKDHLRAWSRHAALNAGMAKSQALAAITGDNRGWPFEGRLSSGKDALHSAVFAALPPTHHTPADMHGMLSRGHRSWYREGVGLPKEASVRRRFLNPIVNIRNRTRLKSGLPSKRLPELTAFLGRRR